MLWWWWWWVLHSERSKFDTKGSRAAMHSPQCLALWVFGEGVVGGMGAKKRGGEGGKELVRSEWVG